MPKTDRTAKILFVCLLLAAATWFVFGQTLDYGFVNFDDGDYVFGNRQVSNGPSLQGARWAFTHAVSGHWHPLTVLTLMLDSGLYGSWVGGFHLTSVLLHAIAVILLFLALREMTGAFSTSAFVAALFCVHPLRAESVAWISERKDVLSGVFFMLTLWAYARYARNAPSLARYLFVVFCFALGLMSKPTLVTMPFVLLLLDYWPLCRFAPATPSIPAIKNRSAPVRLFIEKLPLFALSAASCAATLLAVRGTVEPGHEPLFARAANAIVSYVAYIVQMVCPAGLAAFYPFPNELPLWEVTLAALLLVSLTAAALFLRKKAPWFFVGWLWYLGMLVPMIGLVSPCGKARADRYTYLSEIGLSLVITWTAAEWLRASRTRNRLGPALCGVAVAAIAALMVCAHTQVSYWKNSESLWSHALAVTSLNATAYCELGDALVSEGRLTEAIDQFQTALKIHPDYAEAHQALGIALAESKRVNDAITQFQLALRIKPDSLENRENLAKAFSQIGQIGEALTEYRKALEIDPSSVSGLNDLAWALATCPQASFRNGAEAVQLAQRAANLAPGEDPSIIDTLAAAYAETGRFPEAIQAAGRALALAIAKADRPLARDIEARIKIYRSGLPFRDSGPAGP